MSTPLPLDWTQLVTAFGLVVIAIGASRAFRLGLERDYLWASLRTVTQLFIVGHVLLWIFRQNQLGWVLLAFAFMLGAASVTAARRGKKSGRIPGLLASSGVAITLGCSVTVVAVTALIVRADPWWTPRYFLPLAGMIAGNAMNAAALTAERLVAESSRRRGEIEELLALGATPRQAIADAVRVSIRAGMIPMINSMLTVGLVSLPGMMTGQMIAGAAPSGAARYQIVIMFMLTLATTICAVVLGTLLYRRMFTTAWQLRRELLD